MDNLGQRQRLLRTHPANIDMSGDVAVKAKGHEAFFMHSSCRSRRKELRRMLETFRYWRACRMKGDSDTTAPLIVE